MGGNALFNPVLVEGGTLYIDDGRPLPGQFDETLRNLREISPTYYANVPAGYAALAAAMEEDDALARTFFTISSCWPMAARAAGRSLRPHAGAGGEIHRRARRLLSRGWGSTETAPTSTGTYWDTERVGLIGLPFPGVELKLVPAGPKYEVRHARRQCDAGLLRPPDLTAARSTRRASTDRRRRRVRRSRRSGQGLIFAGRVVEDFKLTTGTFVQVGSLRTDAIAAATPVIQDALVAGQDRDFIGLLAWPNMEACRR